MEFSRQECWRGLLSPSLGNLPDKKINLTFILKKLFTFFQILFQMYVLQATIRASLMAQTVKVSCPQCRRPGFDSWVGKIPWRKKWQSTPALLPGKFHGRRSLIGYSPWGRKKSDMTERLHFTLWLRNIQ